LRRAFSRVFVSKVLAIASNSVCGWKQPLRACSGSASAEAFESVGSAQPPSSSVPSKT